MGREIEFSRSDYTGSNPLYSVAYLTADSTYWNGSVLETNNASHWSSYAIAMTLDTLASAYFADFPNAPTGEYFVRIYEQIGGSPATTDNELASGMFNWHRLPSSTVNLQSDAAIFLSLDEFAEEIIYTPDGLSPITIRAIVDRKVPSRIDEDGKVLADEVEITIANDAVMGVTTIKPGRDTASFAGRFGGVAVSHLVTLVLNSDATMWRLRTR